MNILAIPGRLAMHPLVPLFAWISLLFAFQRMEVHMLQWMVILLLVLAMLTDRRQIMNLLRKTRWLFYSILLLYLLPAAWLIVSGNAPTQMDAAQAVADGAAQCLHLLAALASLSFFVGRLDRSELVDGLYRLMQPLSFVGVNVRKLAVRLMLTLQQVDRLAQSPEGERRQLLAGMFNLPKFESRTIEVEEKAVRFRDWLALLFIILILMNIYL